MNGGYYAQGCCQYDKDRKMKANHNYMRCLIVDQAVVVSTTKIGK